VGGLPSGVTGPGSAPPPHADVLADHHSSGFVRREGRGEPLRRRCHEVL